MTDSLANNNPFDSKSFLKNVTQRPGVYQMYDENGKILYVGKAKNLKNRLTSYFRSSGLTIKTQALVRRIASINVTVAPSEAEALVLEHNLIKSQKPPFNILLRDDKSFPYIFISSGDEFPRIAMHRGTKKKKGNYFGPYPNAFAVKETMSFLQKTFRIRQCEDSVFRNRTRPCLLYQIDRCKGPCVDAVEKNEYENDLHHTELFLAGKSQALQQELKQEMALAAEKLEYERAAQVRDQLSSLSQIQAHQSIEAGVGNQDVIACVSEQGVQCIHILYVRQGRIVGSKSHFPKNQLGDSEEAVLTAFVAHTYLGDRAMDIPSDILVSHVLPDKGVLSEAIKKQSEKSVKIIDQVRTYRAKWLSMALEAARQNLHNHLNDKKTLENRFVALQEALTFDEVPNRIECFDISHSSGELTVGSCVVFDKNGARKSDYRRFNIEGITPGDDYAAMEQVLTRRYTRLQKEQVNMPDLVLIDGGKGQLSMALKVAAELGLHDLPMVGVAKGTTRKPGFETLILADGSERVLKSDDAALHLIQQIRDEAHRFAITGHKARRDKKRRTSTLEGIPGVGPKRRKALLVHFGGLQGVMQASVDDLARADNVSKKLAQEIYNVLHSE